MPPQPVMDGRTASQRGQALAGVMVVMVIIFALAGAVTVGASALLTQQGGPRNAATDDFSAQSAATDALAQVTGLAGAGGLCALPPPDPDLRPPQPSPTPLQVSFPGPTVLGGDVTSTANCVRFDGVSSDPFAYLPIDWSQATSTSCPAPALPASLTGKKVWVFFDARWPAQSGTVWVDGSAARTCAPPAGGGIAGVDNCTKNCLPCRQDVAPTPVTQVAMSCDLSAGGGITAPHLHIQNAAHSPLRALYAIEDDQNGGSVYLLAAATRLPAARDYEEAVLFVSRDGSASQLRYEGAIA